MCHDCVFKKALNHLKQLNTDINGKRENHTPLFLKLVENEIGTTKRRKYFLFSPLFLCQ
jgi:hypothetical protein